MKLIYAIENYLTKINNCCENKILANAIISRFNQKIDYYINQNENNNNQSLVNYRNQVCNVNSVETLFFNKDNIVIHDGYYTYCRMVLTNIYNEDVYRMLCYVFDC